jgi:antitoxin YefM
MYSEALMPTDTTYTHLRENLASILDEVIDQQEVVVVRRKGARDVALIPATEVSA